MIALDTGHINVHEAGAIEFTEHKIINIPGHDGKMRAEDLHKYLEDFKHDGNNAHAVFPGLVYITFPTELGTLYSAAELDAIYQVCRSNNLPLYVDGARLGYGIEAKGSDITLPYLARHCDAFYIGGTKVGALCGEAVVFTHNNAHRHFFTIQKQHGALLAKGRLIGVQFDALFTDGLYFEISRHAIAMAMEMRKIFEEKGYKFWIDSPTNQQFIIMSNADVERLQRDIIFTHWGMADERHAVGGYRPARDRNVCLRRIIFRHAPLVVVEPQVRHGNPTGGYGHRIAGHADSLAGGAIRGFARFYVKANVEIAARRAHPRALEVHGVGLHGREVGRWRHLQHGQGCYRPRPRRPPVRPVVVEQGAIERVGRRSPRRSDRRRKRERVAAVGQCVVDAALAVGVSLNEVGSEQRVFARTFLVAPHPARRECGQEHGGGPLARRK